MSQVVQVLREVRQRLTDPRAWLQGTAYGRRLRNGTIVPGWAKGFDSAQANCWCLSEAINLTLDGLKLNDQGFTELRSDVELELLKTLEELELRPSWAPDRAYPAVYQFNDAPQTSHADTLALLDKTLNRLAPEAA